MNTEHVGSFNYETLQWNELPSHPLDQQQVGSFDATDYQYGAAAHNIGYSNPSLDWQTDPEIPYCHGSQDTEMSTMAYGMQEPLKYPAGPKPSQVTSKRGPEPAKWEQHKPLISKVYKEKGLNEVMKVMRRDHQFKATIKMYKDHVRKWGIEKNVKSNEMKALVRKQIHRARAGKGSIFLLRDAQVPEHKIARFRKGLKSLSDEQILRLRGTTPPNLICYTPLASPLSTPIDLERPERIAKLVHDHVHGCFDGRIWTLPENEGYIQIVHHRGYNGLKFLDHCRYAVRFLKDGKINDGLQMLNIASSGIHLMIMVDDPDFLPHLIRVICINLIPNQMWGIARLLLEHCSAMSDRVKPVGHPFRTLLSGLLGNDPSQLSHVLETALHSQRDCTVQRSGRFSYAGLALQILAVMIDSSHETQGYLGLLQESEQALGALDERCLELRVRLISQYLRQCEYRKAVELAQSVIDNIPGDAGIDFLAFVRSSALTSLAEAQYALYRDDLAEECMHQAILYNVHLLGWEDGESLVCMSILEGWLKEWGRPDEAAHLCRQREDITSTKYKRLQREENEIWEKYTASHPDAVALLNEPSTVQADGDYHKNHWTAEVM